MTDTEEKAMDVVREIIRVDSDILDQYSDDVKRIVAHELVDYFDGVYRNINLKRMKDK